ncbi:hypothetical protein ADICYQ_4773 [Cyclobacterium qasimii M12-11B]|uniref:Uncharacterized protein n=1 Tax=Cyclobacterium qasimii M12-11B TaxID=641524 RepID=S7V774_9BACT|nr:hypothetical protein ADICYQ_4773 [Cyclobacterium qasimii M12-11B]
MNSFPEKLKFNGTYHWKKPFTDAKCRLVKHFLLFEIFQA